MRRMEFLWLPVAGGALLALSGCSGGSAANLFNDGTGGSSNTGAFGGSLATGGENGQAGGGAPASAGSGNTGGTIAGGGTNGGSLTDAQTDARATGTGGINQGSDAGSQRTRPPPMPRLQARAAWLRARMPAGRLTPAAKRTPPMPARSAATESSIQARIAILPCRARPGARRPVTGSACPEPATLCATTFCRATASRRAARVTRACPARISRMERRAGREASARADSVPCRRAATASRWLPKNATTATS